MSIVEWFWGKAKSYISMRRDIARMDWIDLDVKGEDAKEIYEQLFKIKVKGEDYIDRQRNLALMAIPKSFEEYMKGKTKQALRTNVNKAIKKGFECRFFNGEEYLDDIMDINCSADARGGRLMESRYTDLRQVEKFLLSQPIMFGAFTHDGKLIAYIQLLQVNSLLVTNKILGHNDFLNDGVMYFIVAQLVYGVIENQRDITHIMYAHYLVGRRHAGYTYFKERCGFKGTNVRFHLYYA